MTRPALRTLVPVYVPHKLLFLDSNKALSVVFRHIIVGMGDVAGHLQSGYSDVIVIV